MASGMDWLSALLLGGGTFAKQVGDAGEFTRQERLKQEQLRIDQQRADQLLELQKNKLAQDESQFLRGREPSAKDLLPYLMAAKGSAAAAEREQAGRMGQADVLERLGARQPTQLAGALGEGEDPEAAAMIPRTAGRAENPLLLALGGLERQGPLTDYLVKAVESSMRPSASAFTPPPNSRGVPTVNEKGEVSTRYESEPWQYGVARRAVAEKAGLTEGMPGYDTAFFDAISQLVPVTEMGGAATRSQGIPSPAPPGGGPRPEQTPTVITGPRRPVGGEIARSVAGAEQASAAVGRLLERARDPGLQKYLGPFDQYRSEIQRRAPMAMAGEVPLEVVDLDQDMATVANYLLNLRSGAAVTGQEGDRMTKELMKKSSRGPVFAREVENTARNIRLLERRVKELALRGDPKALDTANQYGLLEEGRVSKPQLGDPDYTGVTNEVTRGSAPLGKIMLEGPDGSRVYWPEKKPIPPGARRID